VPQWLGEEIQEMLREGGRELTSLSLSPDSSTSPS
jgi:hypothetical protein